MNVELLEDHNPPEPTPELYATAQQMSERIGNFKLNQGLPVLPVQWDVAVCEKELIGCFGSWRSGKTRGGAIKTIQVACRNPWRPVYEHDSPTSMAVTETLKVIRDSTYRELTSVLPREAILRRWESPQNWRLRLVNGHDVVFRPWGGKIEGASVCTMWLDEAHKLDGPDGPLPLWENLIMRSTDPRARTPTVIATGLPEYGYLADIFDKPANDERETFLCSLRDNFYLSERVIRLLEASTTPEEAAIVIEGRWRKPRTAIYYAFENANLVDLRGRTGLPVDISIDLGDKGAILVMQRIKVRCRDPLGEYWSPGVLVVDEVLPENQSVKDALRDFLRDRPWRFGSESRVYVDPKADRDEIANIKEMLGTDRRDGPKLIKRKAKEKGYSVEYGYRCVNAALRDYHGNRRLLVCNHLPRSERSLITCLRSFKRNPKGDPIRDNYLDHISDCLRYQVTDRLPLVERGRIHRAAA